MSEKPTITRRSYIGVESNGTDYIITIPDSWVKQIPSREDAGILIVSCMLSLFVKEWEKNG